jgi:hypothetical protein
MKTEKYRYIMVSEYVDWTRPMTKKAHDIKTRLDSKAKAQTRAKKQKTKKQGDKI